MVKFNCNEWKKSRCSCPVCLKERICKHVVGLAVKEGLYELRPEAKDIPIGQKRQRGRPTKAKKALLTQ